jgi:hypothetical protein
MNLLEYLVNLVPSLRQAPQEEARMSLLPIMQQQESGAALTEMLADPTWSQALTRGGGTGRLQLPPSYLYMPQARVAYSPGVALGLQMASHADAWRRAMEMRRARQEELMNWIRQIIAARQAAGGGGAVPGPAGGGGGTPPT